MKNLIYKEFKLAWHPLCYLFLVLFNVLILIPNYPSFVGFMLIPIIYTLLFLGTNKGKQTNDLLYSASLPVKKSDIVIARFISMAIMQVISLLLTGTLAPISQLIRISIGDPKDIGFGLNYIGNVLAFGIVCFCAVDGIFLLMFYKNGRNVLAPSLIGMFFIMIVMSIFTLILPLTVPVYKAFFESKIWIQFVSLAISLVIYGISHIFILKQAINRIKHINF